MKECMWCRKNVSEDEVIISAYGYPVCSQQCAEEIDTEEHSYRVGRYPNEALNPEDYKW